MSSDDDDLRYEYKERSGDVRLHENSLDGGTEAVLSNHEFKGQQEVKKKRRKKSSSKEKRQKAPADVQYKSSDHDDNYEDKNYNYNQDEGYEEVRSQEIRQKKRGSKKRENLRADMKKSKSMFISRSDDVEGDRSIKKSSSFNNDLEHYEKEEEQHHHGQIRERRGPKKEKKKSTTQKRRSREHKTARLRNSSSEQMPDSDEYEKKRIPIKNRKDSNGSSVTKSTFSEHKSIRNGENRTSASADLEIGPTNTSNTVTMKKKNPNRSDHKARPQSNPKRPIYNREKNNSDSHDEPTINTYYTRDMTNDPTINTYYSGDMTYESTYQTYDETYGTDDIKFHVGNRPRPRLHKERSFNEISAAGTVVTRDLDCEPYKQDMIDDLIRKAKNPTLPNGYHDVIKQLIEFGVTVYEIGYQSLQEDGDLIGEIKHVTEEVAHLIRTPKHKLDERCLLYRDKSGRPYNLVIVGGSSGLTGAWKSSLATFSGLEAIIALTVLSRSFSCGFEVENLGVKPAYLSLILGLVLSEEIALAHLNIVMLVLRAPSVCSYELLMSFSSDWPRKLIILLLAMAGASPTGGSTQRYMTVVGVALACLVLAANLGSRAWYNLKLRPLRYTGFGYQWVAIFFAICAGLTAPYLGCREVQVGGQVAFTSILKHAFVVAIVFIISDFDEVQRFLISGSEQCDQDVVNVMVGMWWSLSLLVSLVLSGRIKKFVRKPSGEFPDGDGQRLLMEAHDSPVGYKVRNIPDFIVDETLYEQATNIFSLLMLRFFGLCLAIFGGFTIVYLAFTDVDDKITGS